MASFPSPPSIPTASELAAVSAPACESWAITPSPGPVRLAARDLPLTVASAVTSSTPSAAIVSPSVPPSMPTAVASAVAELSAEADWMATPIGMMLRFLVVAVAVLSE